LGIRHPAENVININRKQLLTSHRVAPFLKSRDCFRQPRRSRRRDFKKRKVSVLYGQTVVGFGKCNYVPCRSAASELSSTATLCHCFNTLFFTRHR
tara:strand:+ start:204 stop:491 length:288 start_codon:yes stop_codon:yes gene_type:complete